MLSGFSDWVIIPALIFVAMLLNVTFSTIKIIYISKGHKYLAPFLAFFEVMIWLLAISQVMQNLNNVVYYIAFASGFSLGHFIGISIEQRLAIGTLAVRIITKKNANELIQALKSFDYEVTYLDATGHEGRVNIVFTVIKRKNLSRVLGVINKLNPNAFISVTEVVQANEAAKLAEKAIYTSDYLEFFRRWNKKQEF